MEKILIKYKNSAELSAIKELVEVEFNEILYTLVLREVKIKLSQILAKIAITGDFKGSLKITLPQFYVITHASTKASLLAKGFYDAKLSIHCSKIKRH